MINRIYIYGLLAFVLVLYGCNEPEQLPIEQNNETIKIEREPVNVGNEKVKLQTTMGDIVIEMKGDAAPLTVENFIGYVESGFYDGVIFHRVIPGFMIQGGGLTADMQDKQAKAPVKNEFKISNTRGTVAMAKLGNDPDSATCQFFINLVDNGSNLDNQNGGFTVFGKVIEGMEVADKIAQVNTTYRNGMQNVPVEPVIIESTTIINE